MGRVAAVYFRRIDRFIWIVESEEDMKKFLIKLILNLVLFMARVNRRLLWEACKLLSNYDRVFPNKKYWFRTIQIKKNFEISNNFLYYLYH